MHSEGSHALGDEQPCYVDSEGEQLYLVMHPPSPNVRARSVVVIAGSFGGERERAYLTHAHWARHLAHSGCYAIRFDYRGTGESTGQFETMTLSTWLTDLRNVARLAREQVGEVPLVLCGTRMGGLLASELFAEGVGDALCTWAAPRSGGELLWETLRRVLTTDLMNAPIPRKTREHYVAELESGKRVNVDGYDWTRELWRDADRHHLQSTAVPSKPRLHVDIKAMNHGVAQQLLRRPPPEPATTRIDPSARQLSITCPRFWETTPFLRPPCDALWAHTLAWLEQTTLAERGRGALECVE